MKSLTSLLRASYQERAIKPVIDDQTIFYVCRKLIVREYGARGEQNLEPRYFKEKKLFVAARTSLWAQEFSLSRSVFLVALNQELGQEAVLEIKVESRYRS